MLSVPSVVATTPPNALPDASAAKIVAVAATVNEPAASSNRPVPPAKFPAALMVAIPVALMQLVPEVNLPKRRSPFATRVTNADPAGTSVP